jgi:hypothetical protein
MSVNVYVINRRGITEDVVVGTVNQFIDWVLTKPKYIGDTDPEDIRTSYTEQMNTKITSLPLMGEYVATIHSSPTILSTSGGKRTMRRGKKSAKAKKSRRV